VNYTLPDVRNLGIGELKQYRLILANQLRLANEEIQLMCYNECNICETPEISRGIPSGWGWMRNVPGYIICNKCIDKWVKKYGGLPALFRENDKL
jgi:hypothetical protein